MTNQTGAQDDSEYLVDETMFIDRLAEILVKQVLYGQCKDDKLPDD